MDYMSGPRIHTFLSRARGSPTSWLKGSIKERMRDLVALIVAMVGVGLVWAMVWSWQLTLVRMAMPPLFSWVMAPQAGAGEV